MLFPIAREAGFRIMVPPENVYTFRLCFQFFCNIMITHLLNITSKISIQYFFLILVTVQFPLQILELGWEPLIYIFCDMIELWHTLSTNSTGSRCVTFTLSTSCSCLKHEIDWNHSFNYNVKVFLIYIMNFRIRDICII